MNLHQYAAELDLRIREIVYELERLSGKQQAIVDEMRELRKELSQVRLIRDTL